MAYNLDGIIEFARAAHAARTAHIAFTSSQYASDVWVLSVIEKDEAGHFPLSVDWACGYRRDMALLAQALNDKLGLTHVQAALYIASSMVRERNRA